ncbi:hypothetical protein EW145_g3302 [Phellinidium pouzarii]|uniref:RNA helicase n=1 Tax=Phellinidium pouzarii TaxID=167371 RepID=A0A4S4L7V7_9AGAM|nr:hypothetical protein EW145_g3302 [Phellinidium pouzarii]
MDLYISPEQNRVEASPSPTLGVIPRLKLGSFEPPEGFIDIAFKKGSSPLKIANKIRSRFAPGVFRASTYKTHYQVMLWIEEERERRRDLSRYDFENGELRQKGKFYKLHIDGLASKRPDLLLGDRICVRLSGSGKWVSGIVHDVIDEYVLLHFGKEFKVLRGQKFDIHFVFNAQVYRRMHEALSWEPFFDRITFPRAAHVSRLGKVQNLSGNDIQPFNKNVSKNPAQRQAVTIITRMPPGSVPFVVFGPPGTGKTSTIIEAIRQILYTNPNSRVLACAPTNAAAELITKGLSGLGKKALIQLISPLRRKTSVSKNVLNFTYVNDREQFDFPPQSDLGKFRVVVSTCYIASVLLGIGIQRGHFTHIFIDEAGQATEPESMIPIRTMANDKTNVILSGDVKQLRPVVLSRVASELGLKTSYLDRLMSNPIYDETDGRGAKPLVKLTKSWRSHPAILKFPNEEFYNGDLEACADPGLTHSICNKWHGLVKKDFPIIFHGISSKDEKEASSPSYFNIKEASIVKKYVASLLNDSKLKLKPENIGVISPYQGQVHKIRELLRPFAEEITVGCVEEFQGQERRVIIMSTVRSSSEWSKFDLRRTLGFVADPRRFNVAVTRAQALLIVVGDPFVLALDPIWKAFINYVHLGGGYKGTQIDWDPSKPVDRKARLDKARRRLGRYRLQKK